MRAQYDEIARLSELELEFAEELSQMSLREYTQLVNPGFIYYRHNEILNECLQAVVDGELKRLLIFEPPRHGKSEQCSRTLPAYYLHRYPERWVGLASYGASLAQDMSRAARSNYVRGGGMLGSIRHGEMKTGVEQWQTYLGGGMWVAGVSGSQTGKGINLGLVDDPVKDAKEATSQVVLANHRNWWRTTFTTRQQPGAALIVVMTRWSEQDLVGFLLEQEQWEDAQQNWHIVCLPAIKDSYHYKWPQSCTVAPDWREEGEALCPELYPIEVLRKQMSDPESRHWAEALYQQRPKAMGGNIIRGDWFGRYSTPPLMQYRTIYADTAQKTKERNDFSVFQCWGHGQDGRIYLLDQIRGKWEAPELRRRAQDFWVKHLAMDSVILGVLRKMIVEDKSSGTGLIQEIKASTGIPIDGRERVKDKYTRLLDVIGYIESGYVMLPADAPFTNDFLAECESFTADDSHLYDDQVDPMIDAINDMLAKNAIKYWERLI